MTAMTKPNPRVVTGSSSPTRVVRVAVNEAAAGRRFVGRTHSWPANGGSKQLHDFGRS